MGYTSVGARLLGNARQRSRRGGGRSWEAVRKGILKHLQSDQAALSTTMVDYYGLPRTWPGRERPSRHATLSERAATVERAVLEDISTAIDRPARFVPYVVMHEFEGLLFSDPDRFAQSLGKPSLAPKLRVVRREFQTPEDINGSPDKSPSKRILNLYRDYRKPVDGVLAMAELGLDTVREACPLFDAWVSTLEQQARP
ncbi:MAG: DUF4276 family protein [Rhodospirillales bacterium]|nr:DUF4276 family protein [Rhodospirillales bacterium]